MNVSLTPQLEKYVGDKVKSGKYQTASEVVREALRMMQDRDVRVAELKEKLQVGIDQADRGEFSDMSPADIMRQARSKRVQQHSKSSSRREKKVG